MSERRLSILLFKSLSVCECGQETRTGGEGEGSEGEAGRKRLGRRLLAYIGVEYNQVLYVLCVCIRFEAFPSVTCSFDCRVMHGVLVFMECIDGALLW